MRVSTQTSKMNIIYSATLTYNMCLNKINILKKKKSESEFKYL